MTSKATYIEVSKIQFLAVNQKDTTNFCFLPFILTPTCGYFFCYTPVGSAENEPCVTMELAKAYQQYRLYNYPVSSNQSGTLVPIEGTETPQVLRLPMDVLQEGLHQLGAKSQASTLTKPLLQPFHFYVRKVKSSDPYTWTKTISEDFDTISQQKQTSFAAKVENIQQEVENIQRLVTFAAKVKSSVAKIFPERLEPDNAATDLWTTKLKDANSDRIKLWKELVPMYLPTIIAKAPKWSLGNIWGFMGTETAENMLKTQPVGTYLMRIGKSQAQVVLSGVKANGVVEHFFGESIEDSVAEYINALGLYAKNQIKLAVPSWSQTYEDTGSSRYIKTNATKVPFTMPKEKTPVELELPALVTLPPDVSDGSHSPVIINSDMSRYLPVTKQTVAPVVNPLVNPSVPAVNQTYVGSNNQPASVAPTNSVKQTTLNVNPPVLPIGVSIEINLHAESDSENLVLGALIMANMKVEVGFDVNLEQGIFQVKVSGPSVKEGNVTLSRSQVWKTKTCEFPKLSAKEFFVNQPKKNGDWFVIIVERLHSTGQYSFSAQM